eukprot:2070224-Pyramimonas_sp.AAC.1
MQVSRCSDACETQGAGGTRRGGPTRGCYSRVENAPAVRLGAVRSALGAGPTCAELLEERLALWWGGQWAQ